MTDKWLQREMELSQRHEELVERREVLLRGTETYYDQDTEHSSSFVANYNKAMIRNKRLLKDIDLCLDDLQRESIEPATPKYSTLKNNYWSMVKNIFPVWLDEQKDYERRHGITYSSTKSGRRSPPLSGRRSPQSGRRSPPQSGRRSPQSSLRSPPQSGRRSPQSGRRSPPVSGRKSPGNTLRSNQGSLQGTFRTNTSLRSK